MTCQRSAELSTLNTEVPISRATSQTGVKIVYMKPENARLEAEIPGNIGSLLPVVCITDAAHHDRLSWLDHRFAVESLHVQIGWGKLTRELIFWGVMALSLKMHI
jgi:hypothetical protein